MKRQIEIDVDVFIAITNYRQTFEETENDILRRIFAKNSNGELFIDKFSKSRSEANNTIKNVNSSKDWVYDGAHLPEGVKLQKMYKYKKYEAVIKNGTIFYEGKGYETPSAVAMAINGGSNVNGWTFWKYFNEEKVIAGKNWRV